MKNAQLFSQPFNYIFILIVATLIILFGVFVIRNTLNLGGNIEFVAFRTDLQKEINTFFYLTKGSTTSLSLRAPKELNYICFVDLTSSLRNFPTEYAKILIENKRDYNTFFIPYKKPLDPSYMNITSMKPEKNPLCIKIINKLDIKLENMGDYVLIKSE